MSFTCLDGCRGRRHGARGRGVHGGRGQGGDEGGGSRHRAGRAGLGDEPGLAFAAATEAH